MELIVNNHTNLTVRLEDGTVLYEWKPQQKNKDTFEKVEPTEYIMDSIQSYYEND